MHFCNSSSRRMRHWSTTTPRLGVHRRQALTSRFRVAIIRAIVDHLRRAEKKEAHLVWESAYR